MSWLAFVSSAIKLSLLLFFSSNCVIANSFTAVVNSSGVIFPFFCSLNKAPYLLSDLVICLSPVFWVLILSINTSNCVLISSTEKGDKKSAIIGIPIW